MVITIDAELIVIMLIALILLCYFIDEMAYKKGFEAGVGMGKAWSKPDTMNEVEHGNDR